MSDSFILELPLATNPQEEKTIHIRINAAYHLYRACLTEALRRLALARESTSWKKASLLPRSKERSELFRNALKKNQFSEYSLHAYVKTVTKNCWIGDHLDSQVAQAIASRAFEAADEYCKKKRGKPRFKGIGQFCSVEGKSNITGIRFKDGEILWQDLRLKPIYDLKDRDGVQAHALSHRTKYVRLLRRKIRGNYRFYTQLVLEGKPLNKAKHTIAKDKKVGLDIGPSSIAIVSKEQACLKPFCEELQNRDPKIKSFHKALDRSRRAMNPDNYTEKGVPRRNVIWKSSKRYKKNRERLSGEMRILAATRKALHGQLCNEVLSYGIRIRTEKLSYKSFQKNYGKSTTRRAPGLFMAILRRKAENAGGQVTEFSTYHTKLSQTCHACDKVKKKPLSQRWHICRCGIGPIQRDLYSAFLSLHVEDECLDRTQANMAWASAGPLLEQALSKCKETAKGEQWLASFGFAQRQSGLSVVDGSVTSEVKDVVQGDASPLESFEELDCLAIRTP
jgi:putative transposase